MDLNDDANAAVPASIDQDMEILDLNEDAIELVPSRNANPAAAAANNNNGDLVNNNNEDLEMMGNDDDKKDKNNDPDYVATSDDDDESLVADGSDVEFLRESGSLANDNGWPPRQNLARMLVSRRAPTTFNASTMAQPSVARAAPSVSRDSPPITRATSAPLVARARAEPSVARAPSPVARAASAPSVARAPAPSGDLAPTNYPSVFGASTEALFYFQAYTGCTDVYFGMQTGTRDVSVLAKDHPRGPRNRATMNVLETRERLSNEMLSYLLATTTNHVEYGMGAMCMRLAARQIALSSFKLRHRHGRAEKWVRSGFVQSSMFALLNTIYCTIHIWRYNYGKNMMAVEGIERLVGEEFDQERGDHYMSRMFMDLEYQRNCLLVDVMRVAGKYINRLRGFLDRVDDQIDTLITEKGEEEDGTRYVPRWELCIIQRDAVQSLIQMREEAQIETISAYKWQPRGQQAREEYEVLYDPSEERHESFYE